VVLAAFVLVLLAAASFAAGIAASRTSDTLVYISIFFSLAAFVILAIASLRARRAAGDGPPGGWSSEPARATRTINETEAHAGPLLGGLDPTQLDMTPSWRRQREPWELTDAAIGEDDEDELLEEQLEHEEDEADFEVPVGPVAAAAVEDLGWGLEDERDQEDDKGEDERDRTAAFTPAFHEELEELVELDDDDILDIPEPELEPEPTAEGSFFDEYDDLTAAEILPFLRALDLEGLEWVRARERSGAKRTTVVKQVEQLIVEQGGRRAAATPRKRTPAKKAAPARRAAKSAKKSTRRR
jgi:hypothetical protein